MAEQEIRRQTAYKCNISTLNTGNFVKKQGWESNYLLTEYGDFSRVNIIAVVVGKDENSLNIDDGTGQISGRMFDNVGQLSGIVIGDLVQIIGRPREYNGRIYLTLEIVKKIDTGWIAYRKKELLLVKKIRELRSIPATEKKRLEPEIVENVSTLSSKDKIVKLVGELDKGDGASIDDVLKISKINNGEELVSDMIMRGEIYENKAGHIKLL